MAEHCWGGSVVALSLVVLSSRQTLAVCVFCMTESTPEVTTSSGKPDPRRACRERVAGPDDTSTGTSRR